MAARHRLQNCKGAEPGRLLVKCLFALPQHLQGRQILAQGKAAAAAALGKPPLSPKGGFHFSTRTQDGSRFRGIVLGYYLSSFQDFGLARSA